MTTLGLSRIYLFVASPALLVRGLHCTTTGREQAWASCGLGTVGWTEGWAEGGGVVGIDFTCSTCTRPPSVCRGDWARTISPTYEVSLYDDGASPAVRCLAVGRAEVCMGLRGVGSPVSCTASWVVHARSRVWRWGPGSAVGVGGWACRAVLAWPCASLPAWGSSGLAGPRPCLPGGPNHAGCGRVPHGRGTLCMLGTGDAAMKASLDRDVTRRRWTRTAC